MSDSDPRVLISQLVQVGMDNQAGIFAALKGAVAQHTELQATTTQLATTVTTKFKEVGTKIDIVESTVAVVRDEMAVVKRQLTEAKERDVAKKDAEYRYFMSPLASMFNTETGLVACMPVQYTNENAMTYNVMVISMKFLVWYNKTVRPDGHRTAAETHEFFRGEFSLCQDIPYGDFCAILEKTPFLPLRVSTCEDNNRYNFVMVTIDEWTRVQLRNVEKCTNRPHILPKIAKDIYTDHLGNNVAYTQRAPDDHSSAFDDRFEKSFTIEEKVLVPAMDRTWTAEVLDIPIIRELFGITEEQRGRCHIVGGRLVAATIKTHAEAYAECLPDITRVMKRRLLRAKQRSDKKLKR